MLKRRVGRGRTLIDSLEIQKCVSFLAQNGGLLESENREKKYQTFDAFVGVKEIHLLMKEILTTYSLTNLN